MSQITTPQLVTIGGTVTEQQAQTANVATTWTSATTLNTTTATYAATNYGTANVAVRVPTTTTAGAVTIEVSQDGTDWVPAGSVRQDNSYPENPVPLAYYPGVNGTRIYALSIDAFTLVRVRLSTVIVGAGNVVVTISAVAGGIEPVVAQVSRKVTTYRAVCRLATAGTRRLTVAGTAAGRKQVATIHHAASATKTVRLRKAAVAFDLNSVASVNFVDLVRVTAAPATGNPAITPAPANSASAAAEATVLSLPTTAGTEGAVFSTAFMDVGAAVTPGTIVPVVWAAWMDLVSLGAANLDDMSEAPTIRAGVLEGWALTVETTATTNVTGVALFEFTEESP